MKLSIRLLYSIVLLNNFVKTISAADYSESQQFLDDRKSNREFNEGFCQALTSPANDTLTWAVENCIEKLDNYINNMDEYNSTESNSSLNIREYCEEGLNNINLSKEIANFDPLCNKSLEYVDPVNNVANRACSKKTSGITYLFTACSVIAANTIDKKNDKKLHNKSNFSRKYCKM